MSGEEQCRDVDFRAYLEKTVSASRDSGQFEHLDEALTEPNIGTLVEHVKSFKSEMESSFEKERTGMESRFKSEKNDILKGFLLEKKILNQEHEAEKNTLLHSFVKERQNMLNTFEQQVKDIEMDIFQQNTVHRESKASNETRPKTEKKKNSQSRKSSKCMGDRLSEGGNHIEEVMRDLSLEKKTICEREKHEQDYYRKLERIKEELENEFNHNLRREREKKEEQVASLHKEIDNLKNIKCSVAETWKEQASKLEEEFQKERSELGRHYKEERDKLRKKLEEKNELKLDAQKQEYDESISKLKCELQRIKSDAMKKGQDASNHFVHTQNDLIKKLQENFEMDTRVIREQNDKLTYDIKMLTSEKYELTRQIRELNDKLERESKSGVDMSANLKKEFSTKMKCLLSDNEKLKHTVKNFEGEKDNLNRKLRSCCRNAKDNVEKLSLCERTIAQCEDTITSMRNENKNLSHEINLLRTEKDDLLHKIDGKLETERSLNLDITRLHSEIKDWCNKYALLEREKLQNEKLTAKIRKESETHLSNYTQSNNKLISFENETNKLRQLYENERKENIRLHERFTHDAELIRKKDTENANTRTLLDKIKTEFEGLKGKIEYDNEKIMQIESEKHSLENIVQKLKSAESVHVKHEILAVQNKYVKEFAKRLDYVKSNYEREIQHLKHQVTELRKSSNKKQEVDKEVNQPCHCEDPKSDKPSSRYVSSHVCTDLHCNETMYNGKRDQNGTTQQHESSYKNTVYNIPDLVNIPKISDLYTETETTSSNGSTISSGDLPVHDWENNDTCETVIACGQTHPMKESERITGVNSCECAQYDSLNCYTQKSPSHHKSCTNSSQTHHISLVMDSNHGKVNTKYSEKGNKNVLPVKPNDSSGKKKAEIGQLNSEVST